MDILSTSQLDLDTPAVYAGADYNKWLNATTMTRWRARYRGPRESYKMNQEITALLYDLRRLVEKSNQASDLLESHIDHIVRGNVEIRALVDTLLI